MDEACASLPLDQLILSKFSRHKRNVMEESVLDRRNVLRSVAQRVKIETVADLWNRERWAQQKFFPYPIASAATCNKATGLSLRVIAPTHNHFG